MLAQITTVYSPGAGRVCVVNSAGNVLLDEHVAQKERVTDYRTRFSGIRPRDLVGAPGLEEVQHRVADMFKGRTVVGHAITNDLTVSLPPCWDDLLGKFLWRMPSLTTFLLD